VSLQILFPHLRGFRLLSYQREATRVVLTCERVTPTALCPVCGTAAHRIHSRYQQMLALKKAGLSTGSIAKRLGVGPRTIQHWLALQHGPYAGSRKPRRSPLDWSTRYLRERWEAGERNGTVLWEELRGKPLHWLAPQCLSASCELPRASTAAGIACFA
jgi:RNA polymerase subunit RPABC4/transcription elongation factor Spt4